VGEVSDGEVYAEDEIGEMRCRSRFCLRRVPCFWLGSLYSFSLYITFCLISPSVSPYSISTLTLYIRPISTSSIVFGYVAALSISHAILHLYNLSLSLNPYRNILLHVISSLPANRLSTFAPQTSFPFHQSTPPSAIDNRLSPLTYHLLFPPSHRLQKAEGVPPCHVSGLRGHTRYLAGRYAFGLHHAVPIPVYAPVPSYCIQLLPCNGHVYLNVDNLQLLCSGQRTHLSSSHMNKHTTNIAADLAQVTPNILSSCLESGIYVLLYISR
jgi:hypothetical protein